MPAPEPSAARPAAAATGIGRIALVAGANGLIGRELLGRLDADPRYARIVALLRRPIADLPARCERLTIDFAALQSLEVPGLGPATASAAAIDAYCALGTTIKAAGSKEAFRRVDFDYCVDFAKAALRAGASRLCVVSSAGANRESAIFYSRVKGEMEAAVGALPFSAVHLFRPSLLAGQRAESRPAERFMLAILAPLAPITPVRYRPVTGLAVARAMIAAALGEAHGVVVHESDLIQRFATPT